MLHSYESSILDYLSVYVMLNTLNVVSDLRKRDGLCRCPMEWFSMMIKAQNQINRTRKSISSGEVFPKIIREAQSDLKTHFNALKYVFYRYKTR